MEIIIEPEAEEDLKEVENQHRSYIRDRLQELKQRPINHKDSDYIRIKGREVFKYVMKQGSKGGNPKTH